MVTDDTLAYPAFRERSRPSDAERRRRLIRDAVSWALVAIIHVSFFFVLVISLQQNRDRLGRRTAMETFLDLSLNKNAAPHVNLNKSEVSKDADVSAAPLTIPPPVFVVPVIPPSSDSAPPGDVLKSVGEALACGASNFEYLTRAQQARCHRQPWQGVRLPNGTIVLDAPPKGPPPQIRLSGADELRHQQQTENPCPIMINTPCLHATPNLFDSANGGLFPGLSGSGN